MGFVFDGVSSGNMKIKARLTSWQMFPDIQNNTQMISGKAGVADYGCISKERIIKVSCNIYPQKDFKSLIKILDDVAEWLAPEKGTKKLVFDEIPDRYFEARLYSKVDCERILRSAGAFELTFICPDPYAYSTYEETFNVDTAGVTSVYRCFGNAESYPVYRVSGVIPSGGEAGISIGTNGTILPIIGPLSEGETLVVDTALMVAKVVDSEGETLRNGLPLLKNINFPVLNKAENEITVTVNGEVSFLGLTIEAKSRWR